MHILIPQVLVTVHLLRIKYYVNGQGHGQMFIYIVPQATDSNSIRDIGKDFQQIPKNTKISTTYDSIR
jgi:hypothetical protein